MKLFVFAYQVVSGEVFFDTEHDRHQSSATKNRFVKKFHIFFLNKSIEHRKNPVVESPWEFVGVSSTT